MTSLTISNAMGIGSLGGKLTAGLPLVCGENFGALGGPATGYQGSPTRADFEAYWPDDGLAYLGISPSEPETFYTGFTRHGPVPFPAHAQVTATLTWGTDPLYAYQAYKTFIFRIYAVKNGRAPEVTISNLPTDQILTDAYVEVDLANWTGSNDATYWEPMNEDIDVSPVVQEVFNDGCWPEDNYLQFIYVPVSYPFTEGYITFGGQGLGDEIALNITSI